MSEISETLEILMMVMFGLSWPNNILTSIRNKSTKGKNLLFMILVDIGYICGVTAKFMAGTFKWYVVFFYILNFCMVTTDMMLYFHYRKKEKAEAKTE